MGKGGRFGKYGERKRLERLKQRRKEISISGKRTRPSYKIPRKNPTK